MEIINYSQTINNSHFWSDLNQIVGFFKYEEPNKEFLKIGVKNTIEEGYEIESLIGVEKKETPYFLNLHIVLYFINNFYNKDVFILMIKNTIKNGMNLTKTNNMKMEREEVYKKIDIERTYQDLKWGDRMEINGVKDADKPLSEWINYIEFHLSKAKAAIYHLNSEEAKAELRKVTAIGVRALEIHGCPDRDLANDLTKNIT